jgi:hypothetical protein
MPVIPATQEAEVGGSQFQPSLRQKAGDQPVPVAQACNPSYSGGRDQVSKPVLGNSSKDPIFKKKKKKTLHKKGRVEWLKV